MCFFVLWKKNVWEENENDFVEVIGRFVFEYYVGNKENIFGEFFFSNKRRKFLEIHKTKKFQVFFGWKRK